MYCHFVSILFPLGLSAVILRFIILSTVIFPANNASTIILYANLLINEQFFRSFQLELKKISFITQCAQSTYIQHKRKDTWQNVSKWNDCGQNDILPCTDKYPCFMVFKVNIHCCEWLIVYIDIICSSYFNIRNCNSGKFLWKSV